MGISRTGLSACVACLTALSPAFPAAAQEWQPLCNEAQVCPLSGTRMIRYGSGERFNYGVATRSVYCNNETFGDPAVDAPKHCEIYVTSEDKAGQTAFVQREERIRALEGENQALQAELDDANAEIEQLQHILRRDQRRGGRREQLGPVIIERH